jgi:Septum formation
MTLREESGNGPPAGPGTGGQPPDLPAQQQEPPGSAQEPLAQSPESPAHLKEAALPVPPPRDAPSPLEVPPPREPPSPPAAVAPPREPAAAPGTPGGPASGAGPDPGTGPASPGGGPRRRRRSSRAAILIGGFAAVCLIGLGAFAVVLLLHGRSHAPAAALPPVFRLRAGDCINSAPNGISSPTVVPCGQPHDAEVYARFALTGRRWPGDAAIGTQARQGCTARLGGYLNPQLATTVLAESYVFPDQGAWNAGVRTIICEIRSTAGKLTGSVRGLS